MDKELGYCVKCRKRVEMKDIDYVTMKNGRPACKGKCTECDTGMYKIISKKRMAEIKESLPDPEALPELPEKETEGEGDASNN